MGDAVLYAAYVTNRSPTINKNKTPSELWEGWKPDVTKMRVFGSIAYNYIPRELRQKLDNPGKKMIMLSYVTSGYKLYDEENNKVVCARNVIFDERARTKRKYTYRCQVMMKI